MTTDIYDERFKCAYDKLVDIDTLQPNPKNPNKHPDRQIEMLAKIIKYQGQRSPIVVSNRSGFITKGHGRLAALRKLGFEKAAVDYQDYYDEAQEYADMVADNKIAELAEHDDKFMDKVILEEFPDIDLELLGLDNYKIEMPFEPKTDDDAVPENPPPRAKLGDIYKLGNHRLMCGDSTDKETVEKLMNGEKADMVFTDPPYGISIVKSSSDGATATIGFVSPTGAPSQVAKAREYRAIEGDDKPFDPSLILDLGYETVILWGANHYASRLPDRPQWLVWDKKLEPGKLDHNNFSDCELAWTNKFALSAKTYRHTWAGMLRSGGRKEELKDRVHPTQKPVGLCAEVISDFSEEDESILDLFGGSGSTIIACEKTNRKCFMMELDPHYVDVIIKRWEDYTGRKAELISSLDTLWPICGTLGLLGLAEKNL